MFDLNTVLLSLAITLYIAIIITAVIKKRKRRNKFITVNDCKEQVLILDWLVGISAASMDTSDQGQLTLNNKDNERVAVLRLKDGVISSIDFAKIPPPNAIFKHLNYIQEVFAPD